MDVLSKHTPEECSIDSFFLENLAVFIQVRKFRNNVPPPVNVRSNRLALLCFGVDIPNQLIVCLIVFTARSIIRFRVFGRSKFAELVSSQIVDRLIEQNNVSVYTFIFHTAAIFKVACNERTSSGEICFCKRRIIRTSGDNSCFFPNRGFNERFCEYLSAFDYMFCVETLIFQFIY